MGTMTYGHLRDAVGGDGVALRVRQRLQPAGGQGTSVYPPTYSAEDRARTKYAVEGPHESDRNRYARVVLDSVASQANRLELALEAAWEAGEMGLPVPFVDFSDQPGLEDVDRITALEAPHRVADAIFRDSLLDGTLFRLSDIGKAITEARPANAAGLFTYCPTALLFGQWDSTGPKGGLGSKFQRCLVSEIVGHDVHLGVKVGSRIDPLQIERNAATILAAVDPDEEWTLDPAAAKQEKGQPARFDRTGRQGDAGRPSMINHGNVTPSIDLRAGGVVIDHAAQTLVLSLAGLRKLRFPVDAHGAPIPRERRAEAESVARTAIAALGVAAVSLQSVMDHDLRSRCLLVPESPADLELLGRNGRDPSTFDPNPAAAAALVADAAAAAADVGLAWHTDEIRLTPAPKLVELVRRSRELIAAEEGEEA